MLVIRWTRTLVSLPFVWAGRLAAALRMPMGIPFLKAAWSIGGDGDVALSALGFIRQLTGVEAARAQAAEWMAQRPRPEIAAFAGLLALQAGELDAARGFLTQGQAVGQDRGGLLESLEAGIVDCSGDPAAALELARRLESRRDLGPAVSLAVQNQLLWDAMFRGRFEEAQERADRLWQIDKNPLAATALWALALRGGDESRARRYLKQITLPEAQQLYFRILGCVAIGAADEARHALARLTAVDSSLAERAGRLIEQRGPVA